MIEQKEIMQQWQYLTQESKISKQMTQFADLKLLKEIISEWRQIKDAKNMKRI